MMRRGGPGLVNVPPSNVPPSGDVGERLAALAGQRPWWPLVEPTPRWIRVRIGDERIHAATVIWAAGVRASPAADWLGVPADRRVYLRGWCGANDPVLVAEHPDLGASPAMVEIVLFAFFAFQMLYSRTWGKEPPDGTPWL